MSNLIRKNEKMKQARHFEPIKGMSVNEIKTKKFEKHKDHLLGIFNEKERWASGIFNHSFVREFSC